MINDILDVDCLSLIFDKINTHTNWKQLALVCKYWRDVSDLMKERKAIEFSQIENQYFEIMKPSERDNIGLILQHTTVTYSYLPNQSLHGNYDKVQMNFTTFGKRISTYHSRKVYKFGTLISEEETNTFTAKE